MARLSLFESLPLDEDLILSRNPEDLRRYIEGLVKALEGLYEETAIVVNENEIHPPQSHKISHQDGGSDEINVGGLTGELADPQLPKIIDRGDPSVWDWTLGNFITDGAGHDLDCSSIVPAGARFIIFRVDIQDDAVGSFFVMWKKGHTGNFNAAIKRTAVANEWMDCHFRVACDDNRIVEYKATNTTWSGINVLVRGWIF